MPATITLIRPSFTDIDSLPSATFNGVTVLSGTVPDAEAGAYGVMRLAGDLTGTAGAPVLTATGATAGSYGVNVLNIPQLTVDAKGRITAVADRPLGTAYGKSVIESADEATARAVLGLGGTTFLDAVYVAVMSRQYPVGEMLITRRNANPATWLGFGTWAAYGAGKTLVGHNAAEVEFDSLDKIGGAKTHQLTTAELPAHTHVIDPPATNTSINGDHTHNINVFAHNDSTSGGDQKDLMRHGSPYNQNAATTTAGAHTHTVDIPAFNSGSTGSGQGHNNLQPYITVFFWKRTA